MGILHELYSKPLRVYLFVGVLAALGVWAGLRLPISLYPQTNRPKIQVVANFGDLSATDFRSRYGDRIEQTLRAFQSDDLTVSQVVARYDSSNVEYTATLEWGQDGQRAEEQIGARMVSLAAPWPEEIRNSMGVWHWGSGGGFLAVSFYSETMPVKELFDRLDDALTPQLASISDLGSHWLQNPEARDVRIKLDPAHLLASGARPEVIERQVKDSLRGLRGGGVRLGDNTLSIEVPPLVTSLEGFRTLPIPTKDGQFVPLGQIASIAFEPDANETLFKISGKRSLVLYATPKPGANIKKMAEDLMAIIEDTMAKLPEGVKMKVLVDPSAFIRSAVRHVTHEVLLGATLASLILFLFIGSLRNVATAAIEIPISLVLAFLLMDMTGMSINLISLGGLALSAGMNVDASVVVMENIFRRLEEAKDVADERRRTTIVIEAVKEVWAPVVAATIASLVVFVPLLFTDSLAQAVLGDLAKAVVFSHGFSCFVALLLVPTVRLHLMKGQTIFVPPRSPMERFWGRVEQGYGQAVGVFAARPLTLVLSLSILVVSVAATAHFVVPRLHKEVVGLPESDFVIVRINPRSDMTKESFEEMVDGVDARISESLGSQVDYSFVQMRRNWASILVRLSKRKDMDQAISRLEGELKDTPQLGFRVEPWNPSELPIPNPPQLEIQVAGGTPSEQFDAASSVYEWLEGTDLYPRVFGDVNLDQGRQDLVWRPSPELVAGLRDPVIGDAIRFLSLATGFRWLATWHTPTDTHEVRLGIKEGGLTSLQDVRAVPLRINDQIVPLSTFGEVRPESSTPPIYAIDGERMLRIYARHPKGQESLGRERVSQAQTRFEEFLKQHSEEMPDAVRVEFVEAEKELSDAISQISEALAWSLGLIVLILLMQFGRFAEVALVLVAVPLGFIGSFLALWFMKSSLSLNSILGLILMNGLAVGNSIILVDVMNRLHRQGVAPLEACRRAATTRLRPILITSLTTILGMTPIALGFGEGGRILQPLGISIAGGLWFSTILTLFLVPSLHARLLLYRERRDNGGVGPNGTAELGAASVAKVILACLLAAGASWATPARAEALPQTDETSMQQQLKAWLAEALQQSVNIRATSSQADAARVKSEGTQRFQGLVPKVDASASWTRSFRDDDPSAMLFSFGSPSKLGAQTQERLDGDVQIRSSLFAGGHYFAEHDAALQEWKAAQARATEASAAELERVAHVMVDLLETSQRTQQNLQRQELLAQTLSVAQQRFDRAQIARSDVTRIQRQITLSDSAKTDQSMALELFRRELQSYLQEQPIPQDLPAELFTATSLRFALEGIAKPPQDHNSEGQASEPPTIAALRAELSALSARREVQRAAQRPRLDAVLAADLDRMLRPQSQTGYASSIGLEASWRLYDGGGSGRDDEVFAHEEKALRSRLEATEERHNQDLDRNRTALRRALSSMGKLDRLILDARDAFEAQQKRFSEGRVSVFELVSDAQELWQLEDSLIAQRTLAQKAWMTLCRTLAMAPRQCFMLD